MSDPSPLSEHEALEAINQLRSNLVATQRAGWSDTIYPLVAILNAAGFEVDPDPTDEQLAEHFDTYGGAGGFPGRALKPPSTSARNQARNSLRNLQKMRAAMEGTDA